MKNIFERAAALALSAAIMFSAAGCSRESTDSVSSAALETIDIPSSEPQPTEILDVGEHKDYDKQDTECYYSGELLIAKQDGKPRAMELFSMNIGEGCLEFYANELNKIKEEAGTKVNVYSMIVPTACELYCPPKYQDQIDDQENILQTLNDMLVNVTPVNVLDTLKNHNAENIYFRSDSRWTPLGAYYAGRIFAKEAGVEYADISEYSPSSPKEYVGDLSYMCMPDGDEDLRKNPDEFIFYKPRTSFVTNYYDDEFEFLSADKYYEENKDSLYEGYCKGGFYCLRLDTKAKNDRRLLIVKDDFGTVMPAFLTGSFSQIYVVEYDYLSANLVEMISEFGVTDVLYLMNTYTVTDSSVYTLETIRTQATNGTLKDDAPDTDVPDSSDSDTDTDFDTESDEGYGEPNEPEYIYGVGINNQIGIVEPSSSPIEEQTEEYTAEPQDNYSEDGGSADYEYEYSYEDGADEDGEW